MNRLRFYLFLIIILIQGCSVQKNTLMTRAFHNITAHYNIFFNARESYRKGISKAEKQYVDDFSRVLPVFPFDKPENAAIMSSDMDRVIRKTSKLISNHSIKAKPEIKSREMSPREEQFFNKNEYNKWVDDSYLLMGMAHFRKNDLQSALQTFSYITGNFSDPSTISKAAIWMVKTYDALKKYQEAEKVLKSLAESIQEFSPKVRSFYAAVAADHYLKTGNNESAKIWLTKAFEETSRRKDKYRYAFILGQLALADEDYATAAEYFKKVLKLRPEYDFVFNSRILLAQSAGSAGINVKQVKKDLRKLLRDKKNKEFSDQIYYAFGTIALSEKNENEAIDYFKKSAAASINNNAQKAESYLAIANLAFDQNNYLESQQYYDSAVHVLPQNYPDYETIRTKSGSLNALAGYLNEVQLQDSLQYLASLSNTERNAIIDKIIEQVREEEKKAREDQTIQNYTPGMEMQNQIRFQEELQRGGKWYFYNPSALGFGRNEFKRKWGTRRLEDNWRRKNKMTVNFETVAEGNNPDSTTVISASSGDRKSRSYYLKQIPLSDSMMAASDKKLMEGLFESALILKNDFHDLARAEENLLRLIEKYPGSENPYRLPAYFTLYQIYKEKGDIQNQNKYKNLVIQTFPESEQAKILSDPGYLKKIFDLEKQAEKDYEYVYNLFMQGNYNRVVTLCEEAVNKELPDELKDKYLFLKAQAVGQTMGVRFYKEALQEVVSAASDQGIAGRAKEIINYLNNIRPELKTEELTETAREIYTFSPEAQQILVMIAPDNEVNLNQLKFDLLNFNTDFDPQSDLPVTEHEIYTDSIVLSVDGIGNLNHALLYYNALKADTAMNKYTRNKHIATFLFSEENFKVFSEDKSVETYRIFFDKFYLNDSLPSVKMKHQPQKTDNE